MKADFKTKLIEAKKSISPILKENAETKRPGIYLFERIDEEGITFFYCGQAKNIYQRIVGHWMGFQRIDISMRKRGFKSEENPFGWDFTILENCNIDNLDERESYYILKFLKEGKQTYNLTYGSQGEGKKNIREGKSPKGYRDGLKQGYENARKMVSNLFSKHLTYSQRSDNPNKNQEKAKAKFEAFLRGEDNE